MKTLRLTQRTLGSQKYSTEIAIEGGGLPRQTANSTFSFVLTPQEQEDIRWYLEDFLRNPHDPAPQIATRIEGNLSEIGRGLFKAVFQTNDQTRDLWATIRTQLSDMRVEISAEVEEATTIPWELLRDTKTDTPLALRAHSFVRTQPQTVQRPYFPQMEIATIRILLVICRPGGPEDVPFRSVATRLIKGLRSDASSPFQLDVLRPPTFERLCEALRAAKSKGSPYHIVHFDGHGAFLDMEQLFRDWKEQSDAEQARWLTDFLQNDSDRFSPQVIYPRNLSPGRHGYLSFENPATEFNLRFVDGQELAQLLVETNVQVLVLNACRTAHADPQSRPEDTNRELDPHSQVRAFGSLAQEVMDAGVAGVVAMRYNVYVVTAAQFVADLYGNLVQGRTLGESVTLGRKQLATDPLRAVAYEPRPLQDWSVPIVYEAAPIAFPKKASQSPLNVTVTEGQMTPERAALDPELPKRPDVGFFGRDETLLALDRAFDTHPVVLLHAYAGSGKTTAAAEFARWYGLTGGVQGPILFTSFQHYKPLAHVLDHFGVVFQSLLMRSRIQWLTLTDDERRKVATRILDKIPVLWIWDNVETVTGFPEGADSLWTDDEQRDLLAFLREAADTQAKFLLTSRRDEHAWLGDMPSRVLVPPLLMQDRIQLTRALAAKHGAQMSDVDDWRPLLQFTRGNPLTLTVLVGHALRNKLKMPEQIESFVEELRDGESAFDDEKCAGRAKSLGASLQYGFTNAFSENEQSQLALLHFFQDFVDVHQLRLMGDPAAEWCVPQIRDATLEAITALLDRAAEIGLLTKTAPSVYGIHPALPWFLKRLYDRYYPDNAANPSRAFVDAITIYGASASNHFRGGGIDTIHYLKAQEANLLQAYRLARNDNSWNAVLVILEVLSTVYKYTGRDVEFTRLFNDAITDFVDLSTDDPLPGREEWWTRITDMRALHAADLRRGRDTGYPAPPAQIPACGTTAPGSYLGSLRQPSVLGMVDRFARVETIGRSGAPCEPTSIGRSDCGVSICATRSSRPPTESSPMQTRSTEHRSTSYVP